MNVFDIAQNSGLHDYALEGLFVDYKNSSVRFQLLTPGQVPVEMMIDHFMFFSIQNEVPWGSGHYIYSSAIHRTDANIYQLEIELNSGDRIITNFRFA